MIDIRHIIKIDIISIHHHINPTKKNTTHNRSPIHIPVFRSKGRHTSKKQTIRNI